MKKRISISNENNYNNNKNKLNDNEINSFINSLNFEIKSHYKLIKQCIIEGKNDKIINFDKYLKIEKYLNYFIEKTKNIFWNLKLKTINNNNNNNNLYSLSTLSKSNSNSNIKIKKNENKNKIVHRKNINNIIFNSYNSYTNTIDINENDNHNNNNKKNNNNNNKNIKVKRNISQPSYSKTCNFNIDEKFLNITKDIIDFIEILNKEKKNLFSSSNISDKKLIYEKIIKKLSNLAEILLNFKEINRNKNINFITNSNKENKINDVKNINIQIIEKKLNEKINILSKKIEEKNLLISKLKIENEQLKNLNSENKTTINNLNNELLNEKLDYEKKISDYISINNKLENNINIIKYYIKTHNDFSPENFLILYEKIYENLKFYLISSKNEKVINYDNTFFIPEIYLIDDIKEFNKFNTEKDINEEYLKDIKNIENKYISKIEKYEDNLSKLKEENTFLLNKINIINNSNKLNSAHTSLINVHNLKDEFKIIKPKNNFVKSSNMLNVNLMLDKNNLSFSSKDEDENINYQDFIESEINDNLITNENKLFQLKNLFILLLNDISNIKNLKNIIINIFTLFDFSKEEINEMINNKIKKGNLLNYLKNKTFINKK